jgi:uncharacterized protein (TIGR02246 family)
MPSDRSNAVPRRRPRIVLAAAALAAAFPARADRPADEAAVRRVVEDEVRAWNAGDAKAYAARFADDGGFTNVLGEVRFGRAEFEERHAAVFGTIFRGSRLAQAIRALRLVAPDVAIVHVDAAVSGFAALPPGVRAGADGVLRTRLLQVLVKRGGAWWIEAYHNVDVKPPPAAGGGGGPPAPGAPPVAPGAAR